jgi:hypothetical protein
VKEIRSAKMTHVTVEIRERAPTTGALTFRERVTAPSTGRALRITRDGKLGRRARLLVSIDSETFFVPEGPGQREAT